MLDRLRPDIAVVPESSQVPAIAMDSRLGPAVPHAWTGTYPKKGLGIFAPTATRMEVVEPAAGAGDHGLGVRLELPDAALGVLGVVTAPLTGTGHRTPYMGALVNILQRHEHMFEAGDVVVAGDFNCSGQTDPDAFPELLTELCDTYDLTSAYHSSTGEAVGAETHPTLWWRHKQSDPFNVDFVLVPCAWTVEHVSVGSFEEWCAAGVDARSDHAPVAVDITRV